MAEAVFPDEASDCLAFPSALPVYVQALAIIINSQTMTQIVRQDTDEPESPVAPLYLAW